MMTPRALTDFSGLSMVFSSNFNSMSSVGFGYHELKFCRVRFHSIIAKPLNGDFAVIE